MLSPQLPLAGVSVFSRDSTHKNPVCEHLHHDAECVCIQHESFPAVTLASAAHPGTSSSIMREIFWDPKQPCFCKPCIQPLSAEQALSAVRALSAELPTYLHVQVGLVVLQEAVCVDGLARRPHPQTTAAATRLDKHAAPPGLGISSISRCIC